MDFTSIPSEQDYEERYKLPNGIEPTYVQDDLPTNPRYTEFVVLQPPPVPPVRDEEIMYASRNFWKADSDISAMENSKNSLNYVELRAWWPTSNCPGQTVSMGNFAYSNPYENVGGHNPVNSHSNTDVRSRVKNSGPGLRRTGRTNNRSDRRCGNGMSKDQQKKSACVRERNRMKYMNQAYDVLRSRLPKGRNPPGKKIPKIECLRRAKEYITFLQELVDSQMKQTEFETDAGIYQNISWTTSPEYYNYIKRDAEGYTNNYLTVSSSALNSSADISWQTANPTIHYAQ